MFRPVFYRLLCLLSILGPVTVAPLVAREVSVGDPIPELAFLLEWRQFSADDIADTYNGLLTYGVRLSWRAGINSWFFMSAQYGQKAGNPYYDTPDFEGYEAVHLQVVPVQMGFRWDLIRGTRFKFNFGLAFETVWAEEEIPALSETELADTRTSNGWSHGFQITLGPEWRFRDGGHALGLDIGYGDSGGDLGKGRYKHDLNLTGYNARIYYAIQP